MIEQLTHLEIFIRLTLALLAGAIIGLERERVEKPAGMRTHALVSLGAAAFTVVTILLSQQAYALDGGRSDPVRIIAGIAGGIGFLGAGTIIQSGGHVRGITTAANIWLVGGLGVALGCGYYALAAMTLALAFLVLVGLWYVERLLGLKSKSDE